MGQTFHNLQAVRGVACLLVTAFHLWGWDARYGARTPVLGAVKWFGFAGVDLFFVLSGFLIIHSNRRRFGRPAGVPGYLARRLWRIYPAYWAAMFLTLGTAGALTNWPVGDPGYRADFAWWLTLLPGPENTAIGQAWTLQYEVLFYVAVGAVLWLPRRWAGTVLFGWGVGVVWAWFRPLPSDPSVKMALSPYVLEFLAGAGLAWWAGRRPFGRPLAAVCLAVTWATAAVAVLAWGGAVFPDAMAEARPRVVAFGPPAALVVYAAVAADRAGARPPGWLLKVGDASYSIYLIHFTVMIVAVWVGTFTPHSRGPHLAWLVVTFAASVAAGFGLHHAVERPLMRLAKRPPKPAAPVPASAPTAPARRAA